MAHFIQFRRNRRSSTSSVYMQLLSTLANDLDHMLSELCTTPPPPYDRLSEEDLHTRVDYLNNDPKTLFEKNFHYVNSKLCNDIASIGFAKKLMNTGVTCNALNPGLVKTALLKTAIKVSGLSFFTPILNVLVLLFGKTSYEGAQTHAYLAMAEEVKNITGAFFSDCKQWGHPWVTRNKELCKAVWEESEKFVKLSSKDKI